MTFDDPLLGLATILIAGIIGGELTSRIRLPRVTGWIGTGIALRALELPGLLPADIPKFSPFTDFVLGFIAFTVGATLHIPSLRNSGKRLSLLLLGEATVTPVVVYFALTRLGGVDTDIALLLSVIAIAGAPGTTVIVVLEARARGLLSSTLIAAVGLIDMVAVGAFAFVTVVIKGRGAGLQDGALNVASEFGMALAIGLSCSIAAVALTRRIVGPGFVGPTMVAVILGAWGLARGIDASAILACTFAGIALSNIQHDTARAGEAYLQPFGGVLFAVFYTIVGLRLNFALVVPLVGLVVLYFLARLSGKSVSAFLSMSAARVTSGVRNYLGLALLPHGGVAVGLIFLVQADPAFGHLSETVGALGLATLAVNQLLGPSATRFSLGQAGEVGQDRPRLLDFLEEQRIVIGLSGSREQIMATLADRLYETSPMLVPKAEFVASVLDREAEESTCLGRGLMIPHAMIAEGTEVRGVLGLSAKGLELGAPDDRPVHAVVLLATPEKDRQRHLQILAAFASALTEDENLRDQLYHARSAAHAYEVLHADEREDLNYFLDEALERIHREDSVPTDVPVNRAP